MSETLPWFRFYPETIEDPKLELAARRLHQPKALIIGVWTILLSLASDSPVRGKLMLKEKIAYDLDDLVDMTGIDRDTVDNIVQMFQDLEMIELELDPIPCFVLVNWDRRQYASDNAAERMRQYRQRKTSQPVTAPVTTSLRNSYVTVTASDNRLQITDKDTYSTDQDEFFDLSDAERVYCTITQQSAVPSKAMPYLEKILDLIRHDGIEKAKFQLQNAWDGWINGTTQRGSRPSKTNPAWIDYGIANEVPYTGAGPTPPPTVDPRNIPTEVY